MRVAVAGAGRTVNGTGPYLAQFCAEAGATVVALATRRRDSAQPAVEALLSNHGQAARVYTDVERMLVEEDLDALVIATPRATHASYLELAHSHGLHVLCEKPLVWGGANPAKRAGTLAAAFLQARLWLRVQTQWPLTLPVYRNLHPKAPAVPQRFEMGMAVSYLGLDMLVESLSHPLSMLATFLPGQEARIEDIRIRQAGESWEIRFHYVTQRVSIDSRVDLIHTAKQPRPAWYALDGLRVDRQVEMNPYRLWFDAHGRTVPVPDPARLLVGSFVDDIQAGKPPTIDPAAQAGMEQLVSLMKAAENQT